MHLEGSAGMKNESTWLRMAEKHPDGALTDRQIKKLRIPV